MGLFGSIGKIFGGAAKIVGKVAGVASAVAPIPGLGFVAKGAQLVGGALSTAKRLEGMVGGVMPGGVRPAPVPIVNTMSVLTQALATRTGNPIIPPRVARNGGTVAGVSAAVAAPAPPAAPSPRAAPPKRRRKKARARRRTTRRRRSSRRRGRKLTRAQLRAGFGGKRRMRGR